MEKRDKRRWYQSWILWTVVMGVLAVACTLSGMMGFGEDITWVKWMFPLSIVMLAGSIYLIVHYIPDEYTEEELGKKSKEDLISIALGKYIEAEPDESTEKEETRMNRGWIAGIAGSGVVILALLVFTIIQGISIHNLSEDIRGQRWDIWALEHDVEGLQQHQLASYEDPLYRFKTDYLDDEGLLLEVGLGQLIHSRERNQEAIARWQEENPGLNLVWTSSAWWSLDSDSYFTRIEWETFISLTWGRQYPAE